MRHISRSLTTKLSGIWILHSKEKIKSNILEYFLLKKCNGSTRIRNITQKVNLKLPHIHYFSLAFRLKTKSIKEIVDASVFLGREDNYTIYDLINKYMSFLTSKALNNIAPNYLSLFFMLSVRG